MAVKKAPEDLYFIVERDRLGEYGDERGLTREEANALLEDMTITTDMVIIKGHFVVPKIQPTD